MTTMPHYHNACHKSLWDTAYNKHITNQYETKEFPEEILLFRGQNFKQNVTSDIACITFNSSSFKINKYKKKYFSALVLLEWNTYVGYYMNSCKSDLLGIKRVHWPSFIRKQASAIFQYCIIALSRYHSGPRCKWWFFSIIISSRPVFNADITQQWVSIRITWKHE